MIRLRRRQQSRPRDDTQVVLRWRNPDGSQIEDRSLVFPSQANSAHGVYIMRVGEIGAQFWGDTGTFPIGPETVLTVDVERVR